MKKSKKRLDVYITEQYPDRSRREIQSWIMQGNVTVDGVVVTKPGTMISADAVIECVVREQKYVSRAGFKLEHALAWWQISVEGLVCLDAGISTGGFTDCLLQQGAKKVYGIDVGYGQVHEKIRADTRVVLFERTNLRTLETVGQLVDLVTLDLSFISVLKVMEAVKRVLREQGKLIVLIKPQFEAERSQIRRGGLITDETVHKEVVEKVCAGIVQHQFICHGVVQSPILGATGNKEFLAYFERSAI
ncbi:MAG TPA: TlyA family RNA methyltransferase [Candidatus Bathyarchaeia archaeon]|nr:TlyA family RNA methyltransferase [Candidatus Bathyarchaeia archaeon]